LIDKALADKTDEVSAGSYVGAMIAKMTEAALRLGSQGAQVSPSIIDMDAEYIDEGSTVEDGSPVGPETCGNVGGGGTTHRERRGFVY
jgi:hypothetical protein